MFIYRKLKAFWVGQYKKWYGQGILDLNLSKNNQVVEKAGQLYLKKIDNHDLLTSCSARCAAQFYCQVALKNKTAFWIMNVISAVILPVCLAFWFSKSIFRPVRRKVSADGIKFFPGRDGLVFEIPAQLGHQRLINFSRKSGYFILKDFLVLYRIMAFAICDRYNKYKLVYGLKIAFNLAALRPLIDLYEVSFCCCYLEYNFAASLITCYLNTNGIKTYNIMHGEKFYLARDAFVRFDRFYVWNESYTELFHKLYAQADFHVFMPNRFNLDLSRQKQHGIGILFPPIPRNTTIMEGFIQMLERVSNCSWQIHLRPHPSYMYTFQNYRQMIPNNIHISDPAREDIRSFLKRNDIIIGFYSTVLLEAAMNDRKAVYIRDASVAEIEHYYFIFKLPNVFIQEVQQITPDWLNNFCSYRCEEIQVPE